MIAEKLINKSIPYLLNEDTGAKALDIMETYKISHLPVVDENLLFLGIISENDIYFFNLENQKIKDSRLVPKHFFISKQTHIFGIPQLFKKYSTTILPVVEKDKYLGLISPLSIIQYLSQSFVFLEDGFILLLKTKKNNFSSAQVCSVVEMNKSKILLFQIDEKDDELEVSIKVETDDIESIMNGLEKNGYEVRLLNVNSLKLDELYKERLDYLKKFLEI